MNKCIFLILAFLATSSTWANTSTINAKQINPLVRSPADTRVDGKTETDNFVSLQTIENGSELSIFGNTQGSGWVRLKVISSNENSVLSIFGNTERGGWIRLSTQKYKNQISVSGNTERNGWVRLTMLNNSEINKTITISGNIEHIGLY